MLYSNSKQPSLKSAEKAKARQEAGVAEEDAIIKALKNQPFLYEVLW